MASDYRVNFDESLHGSFYNLYNLSMIFPVDGDIGRQQGADPEMIIHQDVFLAEGSEHQFWSFVRA